VPDHDPALSALAAAADEPFEEGELRTYAVPVGAGECVIAQTADQTLVYDGGPTDETLKDAGRYGGDAPLRALEALGVDEVDHVVVSHLDTDHFAGLERVVAAYDEDPERSVGDVHLGVRGADELSPDAKEFLAAAESATGGPDRLVAALERMAEDGVRDPAAARGTDPVGAEASAIDWRTGDGRPIDLGDGVSVQFLNPFETASEAEAAELDRKWNRDMASAVLHVESEPTGRSALLTGDVYSEADEAVAERFRAAVAHADWLDVPKHGSAKADRHGEVLATADPEAAVVSHAESGDARRAPHPDAAGLDAVRRETDAELFSTGVHGFVLATLDAEGVTVETTRGEAVDPTPEAVAAAADGVDETAVGRTEAPTLGEFDPETAALFESLGRAASGGPSFGMFAADGGETEQSQTESEEVSLAGVGGLFD